MSVKLAERSFEEAIECALLENGPDACAGDAMTVRETLAPYGAGAAPRKASRSLGRREGRGDERRSLRQRPRSISGGARAKAHY